MDKYLSDIYLQDNPLIAFFLYRYATKLLHLHSDMSAY